MSDLQIKVVSVEVSNVPTQKGSYDVAEVTYKNLTFQGKVEAKKIMSFVHKDVFNALKSAKAGDVFTVSRTKDDKGYWQWVAVGTGDAVPVAESAGGVKGAQPTPKSTYETAEERAKKQVYIVRQSSISAAIDTLKTDKKTPTVDEVLAVAKQYEAYVFDTQVVTAKATLPELPEGEEDIPY